MEKGGYPFTEIEAQWQKYWETEKTFRAVDGTTPNGKLAGGKPKYYVLDMFPYPSGQGLHVGHPEGYTASDIIARYKRMKGFNVLHPIGWDAFGLPAEQYAIQTGTHPAVTTQKNIDNMRRQIKSLGFSYDWDRQVDTTDIRYYKWTQWIFLKLFNSWFDEDRQKARPIEELPIPEGLSGKTSGINTSTIGGWPMNRMRRSTGARRWARCWPMKRLSAASANAAAIPSSANPCGNGCCGSPNTPSGCWRDWTRSIGPSRSRNSSRTGSARSVGAEVDFQVDGHEATHPGFHHPAGYAVRGNLYGAGAGTSAGRCDYDAECKQADVNRYRQQAARKSDLDRTDLAKDKTGQFTGAYAINPVNDGQDPHLDQRLCPDQLRHRRDHGRARAR